MPGERGSRTASGLRIVLASNNAKKLAELQALLAPAGIELVTQGRLGVDEAEEPYGTFVENALAKARHASAATGLPALADDSGLCVDALGGAPGVHSARFASFCAGGGPSTGSGRTGAEAAGSPDIPVSDREAHRRAQDAANNALLLERLASRTDRGARFVATLVAVRSADDPEPLIAVGRWFGRIAERPSGDGGFGYDPLMVIDALGASVAELTPSLKNEHSHRALAARQMLTSMRSAWPID